MYAPNAPGGAADMSWSAGTQINGYVWQRQADAAGIAIGQMIPSSDYINSHPQAQAKPETHCELYYRIQCFDKMSITPDIQYILSPFGADAPLTSSNIPIVGVRSEVDF